MPVALTVYRGEGGGDYFLPFMDATTGDDSYSDGRHLDLSLSSDVRQDVDFNYLYNPYCAYYPNCSCPIPPSYNRPTVAITAGEMKFPGAGGH